MSTPPLPESAAMRAGDSRRVLALALDAPSPRLLEQWIAEGLLPNLRALAKRSLVMPIHSQKQHSNEHAWVPVLTGRGRARWDHWLDRWRPEAYSFEEASLFDWIQAPMFYALGSRRRVVAFDLAAPVVPGVEGVQVTGFAAELNESFPQSDPGALIDRLVARYGIDPKTGDAQRTVNAVSGREGVSWTVPCAYDVPRMREFSHALVRSVERRTAACLELMREERWDLFVAGYSEVHTAGHILWHLSQPHPLQVLREAGEPDPLLAVYRAVDRSVGELVRAAGAESVVFFTLDATVTDSLENTRVMFLPEFLYRRRFGRAALAEGDASRPPPPPRLDYREHWKHEIWRLRTAWGEADLESPALQQSRGDPLGWCPANWYRPLWPRMEAFALPSVADGYVRLNVRGREAQGRVDPADFAVLSERLAAEISTLVNARTGEPIVREVVRVRSDPFDADPKKPPADLIVVCREDGPVDVVDSPLVGRIGPVPYFRTSAHQSHGALLANHLYVSGPRAGAPRVRTGPGRLEDVPATILELLGVERPPGFDGVSVLA